MRAQMRHIVGPSRKTSLTNLHKVIIFNLKIEISLFLAIKLTVRRIDKVSLQCEFACVSLKRTACENTCRNMDKNTGVYLGATSCALIKII